jgi:hypothetical protein
LAADLRCASLPTGTSAAALSACAHMMSSPA